MTTDPQTPAESLESIRRALVAAAADRPTPEQIAEWNTADKEMAQRIRSALPGVPLHHAYAVLRALRVTQRLDAAAMPAAPAAVPPTDRAGLRERIADVLAEADGWKWAPGFKAESPAYQGYRSRAGVVLAVLPATVDRGAVLREEAARIRAHCPDHLDSDSAEGAWLACHCAVADDMERPTGTPQPETQAAAVLLSSPCAACRHTLNWHRNDIGCVVARCVCSRFQPPVDTAPAVTLPGKEADSPRSVCVCGHTRGKHVVVSGRLLCDECDPDSTDNLACKGFDAL